MAPLALPAGLLLGCLLDSALGDPQRGHPVALYGSAVGALERGCFADRRVRGVAFAIAALLPVLAGAHRLECAARRRPATHTLAVALATWTVLGGRSLRRCGTGVAESLAGGDLDAARALIPSLCGRDPEALDAAGLARAAVESVAENTSDAVVAPLLWGAVAGVPGLLGYRAVNTLDAMVGHRSPRYARFGTASARLDDAANLLPARLTGALTIAVAARAGGTSGNAWRAWRRDAGRHPSPNAGVCEASAAGALELRLGGRTEYPGRRVEERPPLGDGRAPEPDDILRAVRLSRWIQAGATAVAVAVAAAR